MNHHFSPPCLIGRRLVRLLDRQTQKEVALLSTGKFEAESEASFSQFVSLERNFRAFFGGFIRVGAYATDGSNNKLMFSHAWAVIKGPRELPCEPHDYLNNVSTLANDHELTRGFFAFVEGPITLVDLPSREAIGCPANTRSATVELFTKLLEKPMHLKSVDTWLNIATSTTRLISQD